MITPKFYSQITVCPTCSGWGTKNAPPTTYREVCKECLGQGVSVVQSDNIYIWDAPTYIDYKSRERVIIFKLLAICLILLIFLLLILFIRFALLNMFNY